MSRAVSTQHQPLPSVNHSFCFCSLSFVPTEISSAAESICKDVVNSPDPTELASASNYLTSALATATGGSVSSNSASGNVAVRTDFPVAGMGVMGAAAALAAFAL